MLKKMATAAVSLLGLTSIALADGYNAPSRQACCQFNWTGFYIGANAGVLQWSGLIPGDYAVTETNPGSQWAVQISGSPAVVPVDGGQAAAGIRKQFGDDPFGFNKMDVGQVDRMNDALSSLYISAQQWYCYAGH
jgi:predicted carbohydrate-binding protein with CBM5 and CBM33 domain